MNRALRALLGRSRSEVLLTAVLFVSVLALMGLASTIRGIGYGPDPRLECIGGEGQVVRLNPFLYLPYSVAELDCVSLGGHMNLTLADNFAYTPALYALTVVWWLVVSFLVGRPLSAVISRLRERGRRSRPGT